MVERRAGTDGRVERERADRRRAGGRARTRHYRDRLRIAGRLPARKQRRPVPRCPVCGRLDHGRGFERAGQHRLESGTGGGRGTKVVVATLTPEQRRQVDAALRKALEQIEGGQVVACREVEVEIQRRIRDAVAAVRIELNVKTETRVADATALAEAALRDQIAAETDQRIEAARVEAYRQGWHVGHAAGRAEATARLRRHIRPVQERRPAVAGPEVASPQVAAAHRSKTAVSYTRRVHGGER